MPNARVDPLAQPLTLPCGHVLPNRIGKSAMSEALGTVDNKVTPKLGTLYERWARGGLGLSVTGNVMVDRRALGEPHNVALEDDRDLDAFREWAEKGKTGGTSLFMQLNHPGKQSPKGLNKETVSPSAVPFDPSMTAFFATPRELTVAEIEDIIARFGRAAGLAKQAGFSGVQIHGAHGYLVSQFLSPHHNRREDEWGGTPEKRRRFALEVYGAIRAAVGPEFPVAIKLNSADFQRGGFTEEESLATIVALAEAGMDLVEISGGTYEAPAMTGTTEKKASTVAREAYFLDFAEKVRAAVSVPLMVTGGFRSGPAMRAALEGGAMDVVGIARLVALEPDVAARLLRGEEPQHEVKPITTGISMVDRMALMEVAWYSRQLHRMGAGREPKPNESGMVAFLCNVMDNGWKTMTTRMRAS
jgi:2,4-dienoyl-CoA reductase-like NADH-dependent reductase (Old Yellow Enzyme family)